MKTKYIYLFITCFSINCFAIHKTENADKKNTLYNFNQIEPGHQFFIKNKEGQLNPQRFYNFSVEKMPIKDWSFYDRIEMDVFNPYQTFNFFLLTLADDLTTDYWSQVNYKQTLAPGWNKLSFSLAQLVGERGSHRFQRPINLSKIKKFFIWIDLHSKEDILSKFFTIDNISLTSNPMPTIPKEVLAFDFTSQEAEKVGNMNRIITQTLYNDRRGYGFVAPKFWRVEDSQYASESLRYTIGLLSGHFQIKLPNGKYEIHLIIDGLGYWDVPFWSDRMVYANGNPIFKETRNSGKDFLEDLLKFENVIPENKDNPYDLYLSKLFHPIIKTVEISNGFLDLEFKGDETGINLNTLIVWNKKNQALGEQYVKDFEQRNKNEFSWISHSIIKNKSEFLEKKMSISVIEPDLFLTPENPRKSSASSMNFLGGSGEAPYQMIQINPGNKDEKISWNYSDFTNDKGEKISKEDLQISNLIFQYTSPDNNHETFMITGKYLRPLKDHSAYLKKYNNKYLWLQFKINEKMPRGIFKGEFVIHHGDEAINLPVQISILSYSLPKIEFPVGFFGLDPLPYSYFRGNGYAELRKKYRYLALDAITDAGFTTFTGLPENISELDELFNKSSKLGIQTVFSYGGQFPESIINTSTAIELKSLLGKKNWPKIVYSFSDEASGYSNHIASDIEQAQKLKKSFPFLPLGGFGHFDGGDSNKLNSYFDFGFYSSILKSDITKIRDDNHKWGIYNASAGNLDDPRFSFGLGLYIARLNGLSHYLEWHSTACNNYPYYDFDGREAGVVMFYPTSEGELLPALRFKFATEGLHAYMKLKVLENAISSNSKNTTNGKQAFSWLEEIKKKYSFFSSPSFMSDKSINFRNFELKLNEHLKNIYLKK